MERVVGVSRNAWQSGRLSNVKDHCQLKCRCYANRMSSLSVLSVTVDSDRFYFFALATSFLHSAASVPTQMAISEVGQVAAQYKQKDAARAEQNAHANLHTGSYEDTD